VDEREVFSEKIADAEKCVPKRPMQIDAFSEKWIDFKYELI